MATATTTLMDPSAHYPLPNTHPLTYSTMPMHMYPVMPSSQRTSHARRRQVKNACTNCQKACKKCDDARPCLRCIKYGIPFECIDSQRKERKKGVKRGPYNKRRNCKGSSSVGNLDAPPHQQEVTPITNGGGPNNPSSSFHPALGLRYCNAVYPSQLPQALPGQEYLSPPTSCHQEGPSRLANHHVGHYPSYAAHVHADLHQQHLMTQQSYPYTAVAYGKPEDETFEGQEGGK
ncbi:hypothetical protein GG344DRAFT_70923 [Lentinula edodes]|nr:hypothetical protein GG344DRAFT_70923 [Lentinula edodes]